ncbi:glycosyltransferase family 4 protein [Candidatus Giovannonibacteria bacterium]|nr:glycosyltransferase family 4 protein [Candidatus Giovannonibacteria bacterium]
MKPAIVVLTTVYKPFLGGAEIAIEEIAKNLRGEFDFYILTARLKRNLPAREKTPEGTIIRLGLGTNLDKLLLPFLIFWELLSPSVTADWKLKDRKFLLWGVMVSYASIGAFLVKLFNPKIPFILAIQEGAEEWKFRLRTLGFSWLWWRIIFKKADHVTAISRYLLYKVRDLNYNGPATLVPNGVPEKLLSISVLPMNEPPVIFSASRLVEKNGIDLLLEACGRLKNFFSFRIILAGDGPDKKYLMKLAKGLDLEDRVKFLGEVPYAELPVYYKEADIFVRPSRTEGLGNAFLEAMAAGVITVGTRVGGTSDFLYEGKTGFLAWPNDIEDLADAIRIALTLAPQKRDEIILNARKEIQARFLWITVSNQMKEIFVQLL